MPAYKDEERNTWYVRFYYTDWTGQRKQKKKRGFKTQREAKAFERDFLKEIPQNTDITLQQLYNIYIEDNSEKLKQGTIDIKENIFNNHILPYFKNTKIDKITPSSIRMWQNEILRKNLSYTYTRSINNQMSTIMNYAIKYYGLKSNPCHISGTIGKKNAGEMSFWTLDEYSKFRSVIYREDHICEFDLLYWGGLRKGELVALTPNDILEDSVSINKTASFRSGKIYISTPKTDNSCRVVTLPKFCIDELHHYVNRLYGITPEERIFDINSNNALNKALERYADKAGVKKIRIHDLRHSHASLCVEMGMDILLISKRLGHENIETTLRTYAHLYPDKQKALATELNSKAIETLKLSQKNK